MEISTSILSIKDEMKKNIQKLGKTSTNYIHLDIMDGIFVPNQVDFLEYKDTILETNLPLDVHFMVEDVKKYIDIYRSFNPTYITFHVEVKQDIDDLIETIKKSSKVGISIKPNTPLEVLLPYLDQVDLVLIMSVEPGKGGQAFLMDTIERVKTLNQIRKEKAYSFKIEVDGGMNQETIQYIKDDVDIVVSGSYITNQEDYEKQIRNLVS